MTTWSGDMLKYLGINGVTLAGARPDAWRDIVVVDAPGRKTRRILRRAIQGQARAHEQDGLAMWRKGDRFTLTHLDKRPSGAKWKRV